MTALVSWALFVALSAVAVGMAASMLLTMSMYRAGLALMSSFVALAGLFVMLDADLLAAIQIMMNVGGMLVMVLFMVMLMTDPGGEMMWDMKRKMKLPGPGALSMTMPRMPSPSGDSASPTETSGETTYTCPMHPEIAQPGAGTCPKCGMDLVQRGGATTHEGHGGMSPRQHHQMMVDMAMSTAQLPWAIALGVASAVMLIVLIARTPWRLANTVPTQDATAAVGELLLSRYMIAFEGAAFLILAGIAGAVILGKREDRRHPAPAVPSVAAVYTCPMHPEIRQSGPGECPKCGMALVPADQGAAVDGGHGRLR